jgi:hypothetical protein
MAFDIDSAVPVGDDPSAVGFDVSSAEPHLGPKDVPGPAAVIPPKEEPKGNLAQRAVLKFLGDAESAASVATSIPAQVIGRTAAVARSLMPDRYGDPAGISKSMAEGSSLADALTYSPRGRAGKDNLETLGKVMEATKVEGIGPIAPVGGSGARAVVRSGVPDKVAAASKAGFRMTPDEAGAGVVGRTASGLSGEAKLAKNISGKNQPVVVQKIADDLELPKGTVLDREATEAVREKQGKAYEALRKAGKITADDQYLLDIEDAVADVRAASEDFEHRKASPLLKVAESMASRETFDANSAVSEIKNLRKDAKKAFRAGDEELGRGSLDLARALEDMLDRHISMPEMGSDGAGIPGNVAAVEAFKKARVLIAKSYAADKALRGTEINPKVYADMLEARVPLTGGAKEVGEFARDFPRSAQKPTHMSITGPDWSDAVMSLIGHGASMGKELLLLGARPIARSILSSRGYQKAQNAQVPLEIPVPPPGAAGIGLTAGAMAEPSLRLERK